MSEPGVKINGKCKCGSSTYVAANGSTRCLGCKCTPEKCTCGASVDKVTE